MRILLLLTLFVGYAKANVCDFQIYTYDRIKIQTGQFQSGTCYLSLNDGQNHGMIFKTHLFTDEGKHLVFNSFGQGPSHLDTGSRVYVYLSPVKKLSFSKFKSRLQISIGQNVQYEIDTKTFEFISAKGIRFYEHPEIHPMNQGGFEILNSDYSYIDFGFGMGQSPLWNLAGEFTFYDHSGKTCKSTNQNILARQADDLVWRYHPVAQLESYLQEHCL